MRIESFDWPVEQHSLRVQRLSVTDSRTADTLIFLHDSLGSITTWRDFPERLATRLAMDAIVFDRRGYGQSSPFQLRQRAPGYLEDEGERLGTMLDQLEISSAVLFGHSDGGSIALVAGAVYPSIVRAIITEGAHVFVEERTLAGIREAQGLLRTTNLREKVSRHHGDRTDAVIAAWIETWLSPEFRDWNIESYLPRVVCPTLVIQGTDDEYGTEEQGRAIVAGVSGDGELLMIPRIRHTPHREAPDIVIDATDRFLQGHASDMRRA